MTSRRLRQVSCSPCAVFRNLLCQGMLVAGLLSGVPVFGLMIPLATTTLVDNASCIIEGRVASLSSRWTDDGSSIITEVVVEATDVLLGDTNRVTFQFKGGVVGNTGQRVSDMPSVVTGQQVLVFLRKLSPEEARRDREDRARGRRYALLGAAQGLHRIERGRAIKDGFALVDGPADVDRDIEVKALKRRIHERLAQRAHEGGRR